MSSQVASKKRDPLSRVALYLSMMRYANRHNQDFAKEQFQSFSDMREGLSTFGVSDLEGKRVLDVGCGKSMWLSLLLNTFGAKVTGIDTEHVEAETGIKKYIGILKSSGLERVARTAVWEFFYARPYYKKLSECAGRPLKFKGVDARKSGAEELEFEDNTFDVIVSHEVLEHVPDIEGAAKELARVAKPEAVTYLYVHNYCSVSGGHHIAWKYPDKEPSDTVPPWDHIRENKFPEIPSWLNRKRISEYRRVFEKHFEILDWIMTEEEGRRLLTPEIRQELKAYSEEELLTKGFVIVGKPKK